MSNKEWSSNDVHAPAFLSSSTSTGKCISRRCRFMNTRLSYGTEKGLGRGKGEPQTTALLELSCCPVLKLRTIITCCLKSYPSFKGGSSLGVRGGACSTKENSGSDPRLHVHCHHWETCKNSSGAGEGSGTQVPTCSEISSGVLPCSQRSVNNWGS